MLSLEGRAGIVTGAAGGIGRVLAARFAESGALVALLDRDKAGAGFAAEGLPGAIALGADVSDASAVEQAVEEARRAFGRVDFLVNNAGIRFEQAFLEHDLDSWRQTLDVNLTGAFLCSQAAARRMIPQGSGKIVNIASIAGASALAGRAAYVASKAGLIGLTRAIAWELGPSGIHCNAILPGVIETDLTRHYFDDQERARAIDAATALRRRGTPADLAGAALFLCSSASDYVQGTAIAVDGGWLAGKG